MSTLYREKTKHHNREGWIRGNTKIGPVLEVTTCCLQGKYVVEIRIMSMNIRQFSFVGQNFSWLKQVGHALEQLRAGNLRNAVRSMCVKIECRWFCKPIKGQSKTTKKRLCQLIHKNCTYLWKILDWCWTTRLFAQRLFSVKETDQSSSSWESASDKMMERLNSGQ